MNVAEVHVNLGALKGQLQNELQRACYYIAAGLNAAEQLSEASCWLPATFVRLSPAGNSPWPLDEARQGFQIWLLQSGLRDGVEALGRFLESVRTVLGVWSLLTKQATDSHLLGEDWNRAMFCETREFHRKGLPEKIR
jgi:hypothetical protein